MATSLTRAGGRSTALAKMSIEELRAELGRALTLTAKHLEHLAAVWKELEARGEDLTHLKSGLWNYMPLIASHALRAELVVKYAGHAALLRRLSTLSVEDQDRIVADGRIPVARRVGDEIVVQETPLTRLSIREIGKVFTADGIREPDEQREMLAAAREGTASRKVERKDADSGERIETTIAEIGAARGVAKKMISFPLPVSEAEDLHRSAKRLGISVSAAVRAALHQAGLVHVVEPRREEMAREAAIVRLLEAGSSVSEVAEATGLSGRRIKRIDQERRDGGR